MGRDKRLKKQRKTRNRITQYFAGMTEDQIVAELERLTVEEGLVPSVQSPTGETGYLYMPPTLFEAHLDAFLQSRNGKA